MGVIFSKVAGQLLYSTEKKDAIVDISRWILQFLSK